MIQEPETPASEPAEQIGIVDVVPELFGLDDKNEQKTLRWTLGVALVFHALLLVLTFPTFKDPEPLPAPQQAKAFQVQQLKYKPPPPQQVRQKTPKPKVKKIPIPDPTPEDPEPIEVAEIEVPEIDMTALDDVVFGIPDAPPGPPLGGPNGPLQVGGSVKPPEKLFAPEPRYSEEARQARLQGAVILQTVIDTIGNVVQVKVLKGLPLGLTESAIETVRSWRFKPATQDGEPVSVFYNLVVTFNVQ